MQENKSLSAYRINLKERIVENAMLEFFAKGVKAVKMDNIARQLGISKRTLYELYENKEHLLLESIRHHHRLEESRMMQLRTSNSNVMDIILHAYKENIEKFKNVSPLFFNDIAKYPRIMAMLNEEKDQNRQRFIDFLQRGVDEGYFRPDINFEMVATMFDAIGEYIMKYQLYMKYSMEDILRNAMLTSLRGICTLQGVTVLDAFKL